MTRFEVIRSRPHHCGAMIRRLRVDHPYAPNLHEELRRAFYASSYARSWLIDEHLAAMGGVTGTLISSSGTVWLAVSSMATLFPVAMTREVMRQMNTIMATRREVSAITIWGDERAHRFAEFLGFELQRDLAGDKRLLWKWTKPTPELSEAA